MKKDQCRRWSAEWIPKCVYALHFQVHQHAHGCSPARAKYSSFSWLAVPRLKNIHGSALEIVTRSNIRSPDQ
jgi:hypothetical protein